MHEIYEQQIDLRWLLYRMLREWRLIVVWAVIIGIVLGICKIAVGVLKFQDEDFMKDAQNRYELEYASWLAQGENLAARLENLAETQKRQMEYNEKSVIMHVDPMGVCTASFELYVSYDYQIIPDLTYQNVDMSERILKSYATYMTNGELEQYILSNLSYDIELRYLREIFGVSVDYSNNVITASVTQETTEKCQEILELAKTAIMSKYEAVSANIAEHTIIESNAAAYEYVDVDLADTQKANVLRLADIDMEIKEANENYIEWEESDEPEFEYSIFAIIKNGIKLLIIGGAVGAILMSVGVAFASLLSGKLLNPEDIKNRCGVRVIGMLPAEVQKRPFSFVSDWFARICGITMKVDDYTGLTKMISCSIKQEITSQVNDTGCKKIALVGTIAENELKKVCEAINECDSNTYVPVTNMLKLAESVEKVADSDYVVLVESQETSVFLNIKKELETLKAWNKPVLGAIVVNVDALEK